MLDTRVCYRLVVWSLPVFAMAGAAQADSPPIGPPSLDACLEAHTQAQLFRGQGKLRQALEQMTVCARSECPELARVDCTEWLAQVQRDMPSVVLGAKDSQGHDLIDVQVSMDGQPMTARLDGLAQPVDPGVHTFRFEKRGWPPVEQRVVLRAGEQNRVVSAVLSPPAPPPPPPDSTTWQRIQNAPVSAKILAGVGAVGLVGFGVFAATGLSKESDLDACKPACPEDDVSSVRSRYLAADIFLGVGLVSLGTATYLTLRSPKEQARPAPAKTLSLDVAPHAQGMAASLRGSF